LPTDFVHGLDYRMKKGSKGGYADYSTSSWARRERPLSDSEQAAIKTHGLFNLTDFLPKKPGEVEMKVMKEMFEASVDGEPYDMERWGQYFKPAGMSQNTGDPVKQAPKATPAKSDDDFDDEPAPVAKSTPAPAPKAEASAGGDSRAQDILAMIRNRQK
jgi:hypothetical protein